jgi:hypothetical protein
MSYWQFFKSKLLKSSCGFSAITGDGQLLLKTTCNIIALRNQELYVNTENSRKKRYSLRVVQPVLWHTAKNANQDFCY